jgi:hypothetical protein
MKIIKPPLKDKIIFIFYNMTKRIFFSIKYQKYTLRDNKNFWNVARDEAIYRLDENLSRFAGLAPLSGALRDNKMNCSCLGQME